MQIKNKQFPVETGIEISRTQGVLNNTNFHGHIDLQARCISEASGRFKKVRPAGSQSFLRAERISST